MSQSLTTTKVTPVNAYLMSLSAVSSRRYTKTLLSKVARLHGSTLDDFDWSSISPLWTMQVITQLEANGLMYSSVNLYLSLIKGVAREAWRMDLISGDTFAKIKDIRARRGSRLPVGRVIVDIEIEKMLDFCRSNDNLHGYRDALILVFGCYMGLRASEIGSIKISDVNIPQRQLRVVGKGNKERRLPIPSIVMQYLERWLKSRRDQIKRYHLNGEYLFGRISCASEKVLISLDGISGALVGLRFRGMWAACDDLNYYDCPTPHDMRRTALTRWMDKTGDVRVAQALAGHSNIQTTISYSRSDLYQRMVETIESDDVYVL